MKTVLALLAALVLAAPAMAELVIFQEFANLEVSALSQCPEDPTVVPDFGKHFVDGVIGTTPNLLAEMSSSCGEARMGAQVSVTASTGLISGNFGSSTALDTHGGGYASNAAEFSFRVDAPTTYTFACIGHTAENGDPDQGDMEIRLRGGAIDHHVQFADEFDLEWSGVFVPGVDYTLSMHSGGLRSARLIGDQYLFMDGTTVRAASFVLSFDGNVVKTRPSGWSRLKKSY